MKYRFKPFVPEVLPIFPKDIFSRRRVAVHVRIKPIVLPHAEASTEEWIASVEIGNFWSHSSGGLQGYQDFGGDPAVVMPILTPLLGTQATVTPGFASFTFLETYRIYVDYNMDGDFEDAGELSYDPGFAHDGPVTAPFTTPPFQEEGMTRMRVMMKFKMPGFNDLPVPCEVYPFGQVEDYCVLLKQEVSTTSASQSERGFVPLSVVPNPFQASVLVYMPEQSASGLASYTLSDINGQVIREGQLEGIQHQFRLTDLDTLPAGIYLLLVVDRRGMRQVMKIVK